MLTSGAPPSTVTLSITDPTSIAKLSATLSCTWMSTSGLTIVLKPLNSTVTRYRPDGRLDTT
jgi:hypothetical protein